jgi:hypothetical protein
VSTHFFAACSGEKAKEDGKAHGAIAKTLISADGAKGEKDYCGKVTYSLRNDCTVFVISLTEIAGVGLSYCKPTYGE